MHKLRGSQTWNSFPPTEAPEDAEQRSAANRAVAVSAVGLAITGALELTAAVLSGSVGLLGDALHNLSDVSTSIAVFVGLRYSRRAATPDHPYGFDRAEDLAGLGVALGIWASAVFAGVVSVHKLTAHGHTSHLEIGMLAAAIGIVGNQVVARYKKKVGTRIHSMTLVADAKHSWLDAIASGGALFGLVGVALGVDWADGVAGLLVTAFIVHVGWEVTSEVVGRLMDGVDPELVGCAALSVDGVEHVHVRARWSGALAPVRRRALRSRQLNSQPAFRDWFTPFPDDALGTSARGRGEESRRTEMSEQMSISLERNLSTSERPAPRRRVTLRVLATAVCIVAGYAAGMVAAKAAFGETPQDAASASAGAPAGFRTFVDAKDHFQIAAPSSWLTVDPAAPNINAAFQSLLRKSPRLAQVLGTSAGNLAARGVRFIAVDSTDVHDDEPPNVNVVVTSAPGFTVSDLSKLEAEVLAAYVKAGETVLGVRTVGFDHTTALQVSVITHVEVAGRERNIAATQYGLGANGTFYWISLTGSSPELGELAATFRIR